MQPGAASSEDSQISICVSADHKTTENILPEEGIFRQRQWRSLRILRNVTMWGVPENDVPDKSAKASFHAEKSKFVDAPIIKELRMALECKLVAYDPETCRLIGEIVNVRCGRECSG